MSSISNAGMLNIASRIQVSGDVSIEDTVHKANALINALKELEDLNIDISSASELSSYLLDELSLTLEDFCNHYENISNYLEVNNE